MLKFYVQVVYQIQKMRWCIGELEDIFISCILEQKYKIGKYLLESWKKFFQSILVVCTDCSVDGESEEEVDYLQQGGIVDENYLKIILKLLLFVEI